MGKGGGMILIDCLFLEVFFVMPIIFESYCSTSEVV